MAKSSENWRLLLPSSLNLKVGFPLVWGRARLGPSPPTLGECPYCGVRAQTLPGFAVHTPACLGPWKDRDSTSARIAVWEGGVFRRGRVEVSNE